MRLLPISMCKDEYYVHGIGETYYCYFQPEAVTNEEKLKFCSPQPPPTHPCLGHKLEMISQDRSTII